MKWIKIFDKKAKIAEEAFLVTDGKSIAVKIGSGCTMLSHIAFGSDFRIQDSTHYMLFSDIELPKDNE